MVANMNRRLTNDVTRRIQNLCRVSGNAEEAKRLYNEAEWARKNPIKFQQIQDIDDEVEEEKESEEEKARNTFSHGRVGG